MNRVNDPSGLIRFINTHLKDARWDVVGKQMRILEEEFVKKISKEDEEIWDIIATP